MAGSSEQHAVSEEEGAGYAPPSLDLIAAVALIALAVFYIGMALGFRQPGGWQTAPGLVPIATGLSLVAMAVGLGISAWRRLGQPVVPMPQDDELALDWPRTGAIIVIVFVYMLSLQWLSFPMHTTIAGTYIEGGVFEVATTLCLATLMRMFWGGRFWIIATLSIAWTAVLSVVFRTIFFVVLPM